MAKRYVMTARRKAALRKAQLASARKRRKGRVRAHLRKKHPNGKLPNGRHLTYGQVYANRAVVAAGAAVYGGVYASLLYPGKATRAKNKVKASFTSTSRQRGNPVSRYRTNRQFKKMVKSY